MKVLLRIIALLGCLFVAAFAMFLFIHRDRRPPIFHAVADGDTNAIAQYLRLGSNVNSPILSYPYGGNRDAPLLDIAVANGQLETIVFRLKSGANPNQPDYSGEAPSQWALGRLENDVPVEKRAKILKTLIDSGADPNQKDANYYGYTPLIRAAEFGEGETVTILLAAGARVDATNNESGTALHFARNAEIARLLIAAGADRNAQASGATPAQTAVRFGHLSALTVLTNETDSNP